ncbi:beta-secretase 1-like [Amphiura filiformis]|uniref:beta-secretase 1-like n=1 Tax=Amphiura filiformis TaxID=82378 RepID=UPI003B21148C
MWVGKRSILTLFSTLTLVQFDLSHQTKIYSLKLRTSAQASSSIDGAVQVRRRRSVGASDNGDVRWKYARNNLRGRAGQGYYIEMSIGTPKQNFHVLVDTGSANFAVAAAPHEFIKTFFKTNESTTYKDLKKKVKVPYTQGEWDGNLCQDMTSIVTGPDVAVMSNIAAITHSEAFFINGSNWQGILGLGYADIARPDNTVEPFFTTLVRQGHVENIFAIQLCGPNLNKQPSSAGATEAEVAGTMTVGGVDDTLYNGTMWYTPLTKERFYEVVVVDMEVNNESLAMDCKEYNFDKTIVDSGTTNLRLPEAVFSKLNAKITQVLKPILKNKTIPPEFWSGDQLICRDGPIEPWDWFPTISITLQGMDEEQAFKLVVSPKQYLSIVEPDSEHCYKYGISSSKSGAVIGAVVMEGFYVVFDRNNKSVGFAMSTCADQTEIPVMAPNIVGPLRINSTGCAYNVMSPDNQILLIIAYIMAAICVLCLVVPMIFLYVHWQMEKCRGKPDAPDDNGLLRQTESDS